IDPIAVDVPVLDDYIAEINANPEDDPPVLGRRAVALFHALLHRHSASDRFDNAGKLDKATFAGGFADATLLIGELRSDELAVVGSEPRECPLLAGAHQP